MDMQITLALRYITGRKLRSVLTTIAIVFGVMVIFGMNSILPAFENAFQANAMAVAGQVDVTITSQTGEAFPQSVTETVAGVDGITSFSGSLERIVGLQPDYFDNDPARPDRVSAVDLVGIVPDQARAITVYQVTAGRFLQEGDTTSAVIAQSLADEAGVQVGGVLDLPTPSGTVHLSIVGLLPQRLLPGNEEILVTLPEAQQLFGAEGMINIIDANFDSGDDARRKEIENNLNAALGSSYVLGVLQSGTELLANIGIAKGIFTMLGVLSLLMGGFIIFNTFRTIVAERRRDIGMLRSIGARRSTIISIMLIEGLIQGTAGTIAGVGLGYGIAVLMGQAMNAFLHQFINITIGAVPLLPSALITAVLAGIGVTVLAGIIPARSASRVEPLEAMRPSVAQVEVRRMGGAGFWIGTGMIAAAAVALLTQNTGLIGLGSLLVVIGLILVGPALVEPIARGFGTLLSLVFARSGTAQLAEGNLTRQPGRAAITASTTMIALTILVMASSVIASAALSFTNMLRNSLGSDFLLLPPSVSTWGMDTGASPDLAASLRKLDGIAVVSTTRFATTKINNQAVGLLGINPVDYQQTSGLTFLEGDPQTAFAGMQTGRGMIVNGVLAGRAGIKPGDAVTVLTATGEVTYQIVGIASDYLNAKTMSAYISQENIASDFGKKEDVFIQANMTPGADQAAVQAAIKSAMDNYPQFKLVVGQEYIDQNVSLLSNMFMVLIVLLFFLAIPSLVAMVNTLAIGVLERRREIGMLRAVGGTRRQINTIILAEALILAAIGTVFGILAGTYLGYSAAGAFGAAGFPMDYIFPLNGILLALAGGLIFGALAAIVPARQATHLEIVEALRYE